MNYMNKNEVEIDVRFSDIDSMLIAHNSKYYIWFEIGRFAFSSDILNLSINDLNTDYLLPVVKSCCKYLYSIHFGDKLKVTTYMYLNQTTKMSFFYKIENQNHKLCAIGSTQHAMLNREGKIVYQFDDKLKEKFWGAMNDYPSYFLTEDQKNNMESRVNR